MTPESPYKGLRPFDETEVDALLFFGRERETELVIANLMAARLTVLYGPSGVGKSSVLRAGVMHRMRAGGDVVVRFEAWSGDPVAGISDAVRKEVGDHLGEEVDEISGSLATRLRGWSELLSGDIFLVLDQVEEYFLYHGRNGRRGGLLDELPDVVTEPGLRVNVLLGIREEGLALLDAFKARIPLVLGNYLRLDRLDRPAGEAAILGPLAAWGELAGEEVAAEPELVEALLDEVSVEDGRIEAPYLQVVLERVWEAERSAGSSLLRRSTLADLGGAERIIDEHLERALAGLEGADRDTAAAMFAHLVTPGGTKIAHELHDLASYAGTDVRPVASALVRERILRPVDGGSNGGRVEIYHDVLAAAVADWRRRHETERQLARERRRHRKLAATIGVLILGLALMTGLAVYAFSQREEARDRARSASARELTAHALAQLAVDPELSVLLAVEAAARERTRQVEDALRRALSASQVRTVQPAPSRVHAVSFTDGGSVRVVDERARQDLRATTAPVLSTDGSTLAFGRGASLVAVRGDRETALPLPAAPMRVAASGDGNIVAAAYARSIVRVYALPEPAAKLFRVSGRPNRVALDWDGEHLAVASGTSVYTWTIATGRAGPVIEDRATVTALALSPDGALVAVGLADGSARLWARASGRLAVALPNHSNPVTRVVFSADGARLLTTSPDGVARTWLAEAAHLFAVLRGHTGAITAGAFDGDAGRVATAAEDGTLRVWESGVAPELEPLMSGSVPFLDAVVTANGAVVAADAIGIRVDGRRVVAVPGGLGVAALSRDGRLGVGARGRDVTLLRTADGVALAKIRAPAEVVSAAVTNAYVTIGGADGVAWLRALDGGPLMPLRGHAGGVTGVGLSSDGAHVATGDERGDVRIWELPSGRLLHVLRGHRDLVTSAVFSAGGGKLATASRDRDARIWSVAAGRPLQTLVGHFAIVSEASFSPDERMVVTAGPVSAGLWLRAGEAPGYLRGHSSRVTSAAFAPDGITIVTASRDGTVRRYRCALCQTIDGLLRLARERLALTGRAMTRAERARYLGER